MSFPVIIIFLVLYLWFVICLPLLGFFYPEGKLSKVYDMVILLSLCASIVMNIIIVFSCVIMLIMLIASEVMKWVKSVFV